MTNLAPRCFSPIVPRHLLLYIMDGGIKPAADTSGWDRCVRRKVSELSKLHKSRLMELN